MALVGTAPRSRRHHVDLGAVEFEDDPAADPALVLSGAHLDDRQALAGDDHDATAPNRVAIDFGAIELHSSVSACTARAALPGRAELTFLRPRCRRSRESESQQHAG